MYVACKVVTCNGNPGFEKCALLAKLMLTVLHKWRCWVWNVYAACKVVVYNGDHGFGKCALLAKLLLTMVIRKCTLLAKFLLPRVILGLESVRCLQSCCLQWRSWVWEVYAACKVVASKSDPGFGKCTLLAKLPCYLQ